MNGRSRPPCWRPGPVQCRKTENDRMDQHELLEAHMSRIAQEWVSTVLLLGAFLFLLLGIMDLLTAPEHALRFLLYRGGISLVLLLLFSLNRLKTNKRYQYLIVICATAASAATIEMMVLSFGGHRSTYYAGFNLVVICALGFIPINLALSSVLLVIIYAIYLLPIVLTDRITDPVFISNNFFMLGTFIIALAWRYQNQKLIVREFLLRQELAGEQQKLRDYSLHLEDVVRERTQKLHRSEQWHRSLFENATDGILVLDSSGIILNANDKACSMHGFPREALIGTNASLLVAGEGQVRHLDRMRRLVAGEALVYETEHYRKDGSRMSLEVSAKAIWSGEQLMVQAFLRDITERKKIQEHLFQSQKMESIGTLAGGIAHDFNNVLTAIIGYLEVIRRESASNETILRVVGIMERAARSAGRMIAQLLGFARTGEFAPMALNVNDAVQDTVKLMERVLAGRVTVSLHLEEDVPIVDGDITQIEQVLMNLIGNARDAMPEGGTITIRSWSATAGEGSGLPPYIPAGRYAVLQVADTGCGIPDDAKERIFEPFFTTKERGKGTGLGLAMVYGVVTKHRGYITVRSRRGEGTEFTLYFPAGAGQAVFPHPYSPARLGGNETVLVVDDDEDVLTFVKETLEGNGYDVLVAANPVVAIDIFRIEKDRIALVVTDIVMPLIDGGDLVRKVRELKPGVRLLTISGFRGPEALEESVRTAPFLPKPFDGKRLLTTVRQVLDGPYSSR
jgi:PAS domain S-box-containing protein